MCISNQGLCNNVTCYQKDTYVIKWQVQGTGTDSNAFIVFSFENHQIVLHLPFQGLIYLTM